jgi:hypothetical protein
MRPQRSPSARWKVRCCLEDVVVGDEAALSVLISASGNCTIVSAKLSGLGTAGAG